MEKRRLRSAVSGLALWKRDPPFWPDLHSIYSNVPLSSLFISSKFSISGSLPTSSNRLSRQAYYSGRLTFQIHTITSIHLSRTECLAARAFSGGFTTPLICKPKSAMEERNKTRAYFRITTLRLSHLFVYIANLLSGKMKDSELLAYQLLGNCMAI
jgi:hypothetical protein